MLKVTVNNKKNVDERWDVGVIRMDEDGENVLMVVGFPGSTGALMPAVLTLKSPRESEVGILITNPNKEFIIRNMPIVVENAELIIGGN